MLPLLRINRLPASQSKTAEALVAGILVLCMALGCLPLVHRYYPHSQTAKRVLLLAGSLAALLALLRPPLPVGGGAECPDLPFGLCPRLWDKAHVPEHEEDDVSIWGEAGTCCAAGTTAGGMQGIACWTGCTFCAEVQAVLAGVPCPTKRAVPHKACCAPQSVLCPTNPAPALIPTPSAPPPTPVRRRPAPSHALAAVVHAGLCLPGGHSHDTDQPRRAQRPAAHRAGQCQSPACFASDCPRHPDCPALCAALCASASPLSHLHATTQRPNSVAPLLPCPLCCSGGGQCGHGGGLPRPRVLPGAAAGAGGWGKAAMCTRCHPSCLVEHKQACLPAWPL